MANTVDKIRIQQALIDQARSASYYAVSYDPKSNKPNDVDAGVGGNPVVGPKSVGVNEVSSAFVEDPQHGRSQIRKRESWLWVVICKFNTEVTSYVAEDAWLLSPPVLPRSGSLRQVTLNLISATYEHPVRQEGHNGSRITFIFEARLSRR